MESFRLIGGSIVAIALLAIYIPTIYIRKSNKVLEALKQIAANTAEPSQHPARRAGVA
jgi:hypothetical protein